MLPARPTANPAIAGISSLACGGKYKPHRADTTYAIAKTWWRITRVRIYILAFSTLRGNVWFLITNLRQKSFQATDENEHRVEC
jgi:hypothetical protein